MRFTVRVLISTDDPAGRFFGGALASSSRTVDLNAELARGQVQDVADLAAERCVRNLQHLPGLAVLKSGEGA